MRRRWFRFIDWLGWKFNAAALWCFNHTDETPDWIVGNNRPPERYENGEF